MQIWGIDSYGSVLKKYHETGEFDENEIYPYITEGVGEDILPENVNFDTIDHFEKVTDKDGAAGGTGTREEGRPIPWVQLWKHLPRLAPVEGPPQAHRPRGVLVPRPRLTVRR